MFKKFVSSRILQSQNKSAQNLLIKNFSSNNENFRVEYDSFGPINVPSDKYWAAQTQRSLQNFAIGTKEDKMPISVFRSIAIIKKSAAKVNMKYGLPEDIGNAIINSANEVIEGKLDDHFPLVIFQTGSGTQSNMNTNEVISNRSAEFMGGKRGEKSKVHPNDHVNMSQSSNDTYPTAMHVATMIDLNRFLLPQLNKLEINLQNKVNDFQDIIKIGRTHTQDATPLTLGQEFSGYLTQVRNHIEHVKSNLKFIGQLAQGGTAVGTGLNTKKGFDVNMAKQIAEETNLPFETAPNKFESLAAHDALCHLSGSINALATALFKIAQDVKLLSTELLELKVNDVNACEELLQACVQAMGNHTAVTVGSN